MGVFPVLWMTSYLDIFAAQCTLCVFNKQINKLRLLEVTIRYDTRCYFNVRSKADISQLNLLHGETARLRQ